MIGNSLLSMELQSSLIAPRIRGAAMKTIARVNDEFRSTLEDGRVLMTAAYEIVAVCAVNRLLILSENRRMHLRKSLLMRPYRRSSALPK